MERTSWALVAVGVFMAVRCVGNVLDQIPILSAKAERAIDALRRLRAAWCDNGEPAGRAQPEQESCEQGRSAPARKRS
ncbi:hypothetical protein GCM10010389_16750 [Streptomyces echinoruber]|uniref:Uncharacterized protein n=1 Tax=Streptomyces echinoruber TaxID=68898 RepID=A0A918R113_9ACTN|nr:hypothetical protein GCM10010389_16750 [Streptomyces echinoruber]